MKKAISGILFSLLAFVCIAAEPITAPVSIEFRWAENRPGAGLVEMRVGDSEQKIYARKQVVLANADIAAAAVVSANGSWPQIEILFTKKGSAKLSEATISHIGKILAIIVDGKVVSAPMIREPIMFERAIITGAFSTEEAEHIAASLSAAK